MESDIRQNSAEDIICYGVCGKVVKRQNRILLDNQIFRHYPNQLSQIRICDDCAEGATPCSICGVPAAKQFKAAQKLFRDAQECDHGYRCFICSQTIIDEGKAGSAYNSIVRVLDEQLGMKLSTTPPLELVAFTRLQELQVEAKANYEINGLCRFVGNTPQIFIRSFLPRAWFVEAAAHELAHAWHFFSSPSFATQEAKFKEGFAVWVACQVLQAVADKLPSDGAALWIKQDAQTLIGERKEDTGPIFGAGLKYFLDLEQKQGREAVFQAVKTGKF